MKKITAVLLFLLLIACGNSKKEDQVEKKSTPEPKSISADGPKFAKRTELVHQKDIFEEKGLVEFRMTMNFPDKEQLQQNVRMATDSTLIRVDRKGETSIFNGKEIYTSSKDSTNIEINNLNLGYLFSLPFSLSNANIKWDSEELNTSNENLRAIKFTYTERPKISPSPWFVVYSDKRTDLLRALAFVDSNLNNGKPIAVQFENYITVKSIPIATRWKFHVWNEENGIGDEIIGTIKISNISFSGFDESVFDEK